jgi:curved DNA-binding protein CbpA
MQLDYYEILGVSPEASDQEIREAYKRKSLATHPDRAAKNQLTIEKSTEEFKRVKEAYDVLSDSDSRSIYNANRFKIVPYNRSTAAQSIDMDFYIRAAKIRSIFIRMSQFSAMSYISTTFLQVKQLGFQSLFWLCSIWGLFTSAVKNSTK